jgi:hypothetical protein
VSNSFYVDKKNIAKFWNHESMPSKIGNVMRKVNLVFQTNRILMLDTGCWILENTILHRKSRMQHSLHFNLFYESQILLFDGVRDKHKSFIKDLLIDIIAYPIFIVEVKYCRIDGFD